MERSYLEDKSFDKTDFAAHPPAKGDYEYCRFTGCNFSNADLAHIHFIDCTFTDCNFSNTRILQTVFRDVAFQGCKLLGLRWETISHFLFNATFTNCSLHLSTFTAMKLNRFVFKDSQLHEVDFTEADLSEAIFDHCDLNRALFDNTNLEKADFRTAFNYQLNPDRNKIKKARFSSQGLAGLLGKYDIEIQ